MCGPEQHTSRFAAQVERAQRPDADALGTRLRGRRGEGAKFRRALARCPATRCFCFPRAGEFGTAQGGERPTQESHVRATCARTRAALLEGHADHGTNATLRVAVEMGPKAFRSH